MIEQRNDGHGRSIGLDILRSVAILLVIASHYANNISFWYGITPPHQVFFSGDLGVDLFFALSGFLIGRILIDVAARAPTKRSLGVFLARRWLRTLPVYFSWLLVILIFDPPAGHVWEYALRFFTLTQNLLQPMPADYWFAVSWSLTIEEWFYLLFGSAAILCSTLVGRSWAIWVPLLLLLTVPPALRQSISLQSYLNDGYAKIVPLRLDEIGYGVVVAWLYTRGTGGSWIFRHPLLPLMAGIGLVAAAWLNLLPIPFRLYALFRNDLAVVGCALCIPAALRVRTAPRWLAFLARHISRLSYALYLVHLTILVSVAQSLWFQKRISAETAVLIAVFVTLAVAEIMSRCIEQPLMRRRPRQFPDRERSLATHGGQEVPAVSR